MTVTDEEFRTVIIVFSAVCFCLFVICIILCVSVGFIISKLKHHDRSIEELGQREYRIINQTAAKDERGYCLQEQIETGVKENENKNKNIELRRTARTASLYNPRMEIIIEKETVNVYGNKAPTGHLISIAQNYYKEENQTDTSVPTESIDILDKTANTKLGTSMIFTNDWMGGGVPTSLLLDGGANYMDNIATQNKGIFIHKTIGPEGNTMTISGVKLIIPPNAIGKPTMISLGILWDEHFVPYLRKKQTLLSPLVLCQPSRLKFNQPVTLSFPHAAIDVKDDWKTKIIKREGNLTNNSNWSQLTEWDCTSVFIDSEQVKVELNHFTLYTCVGESRSKRVAKKGVQVVAFAGRLTAGEYFKPRIYCLNKYNEDIEDIKLVERDIDNISKVHETSNLIVHDNDLDVMVELTDLLEHWNVLGNKIECIQFEQIWHGMQPHCTFILEAVKKVTEIRSEYQVYQVGRENSPAKLKIFEKVKASNSEKEENTHNELLNELMVLLDPENEIGSDAGNWRDLAERMGCNIARVRWLRSQGSPTKVLFRKWIDEERRSLAELEQLLRDINRPDAADEVRQYLNSSNQSQTRMLTECHL